jgi:hypothetical protein
MENQLNIIKMVKNVRNLKMISKFSLLTPRLKQQLTHAEKNLINLEESDEIKGSESASNEDSGIEGFDVSDSEAEFPKYKKKKNP